MTKYLLFIGTKYYPGTGADDFVASYDTPEEASKRVEAQPEDDRTCMWWSITKWDGVELVHFLDGDWE